MERLILTNCVSTSDLESFERIALEVVKKGSEEMAVPALKLLMTCIYIGEDGRRRGNEYEKMNNVS